MKVDYAPRDCIPLKAGTLVTHPDELPELVHLHDPAASVFIDFASVKPETVTMDTPIDVAHAKLHASEHSLLLVADANGAMQGMLTLDECDGDAPIRLANSHHIDHSEIKVGMVMTPLREIKALQWSHLKDACVGHIVSTLHQLEYQQLLVVEQNKIRGVFSASHIKKQIVHAVTDDVAPAHSLAEIVRTLHQ